MQRSDEPVAAGAVSASGGTRARLRMAAAAALALAMATGIRAQTDEIQVYDASVAAPGTFNLTLHNNYTFSGNRSAEFPGGISPRHSLNGVPEWAYGAAPWLEVGLYLPLYSVEPGGTMVTDGAKARILFAAPDAAKRNFFYGVNLEFSYNAPHWDPHRLGSEIRPIVGWRTGRITFIVNPILDNSFTGARNLEFAPAARLSLAVSPRWTIAVEEYADVGPISGFLPARQQSHQLFGVVDFAGSPVELEFGLGAGLTRASDDLVGKLILSMDLN